MCACVKCGRVSAVAIQREALHTYSLINKPFQKMQNKKDPLAHQRADAACACACAREQDCFCKLAELAQGPAARH